MPDITQWRVWHDDDEDDDDEEEDDDDDMMIMIMYRHYLNSFAIKFKENRNICVLLRYC